MKNPDAIYWILFWNLSVNAINEIIYKAMMNNDFEKAKLYCKALVFKIADISPESFYNKYCKGVN